jgi:oligopeptide transport system substrate-binding protein
MRCFTKKFFPVMLAVLAIGMFAACQPRTVATATSSAPSTEIKDLVYPTLQANEMETFNILFSQGAIDLNVLTNLLDGLLEADAWGNLIPAVAERWGTNDGGLTWTFNLRRGVQWVDLNGRPKAPCNANDWGTALEWILNFHKNDSANTTMPIELIAGSADYYEYTKSLTQEEARSLKADKGSRFFQMVGIEIPDDYTIIYRCPAQKPYFASLAIYNVLYPMSQAMVDELGGVDAVKAMDNRGLWYNGPYTMTSYIQRNEKVYTKNPLYWDTNCDRFDTVTIKMIDSWDIAYQLYQSGEVDYVLLTESMTNTIYNNPNHQYNKYIIPDPLTKYSWQFHFNYDKRNSDGSPETNWNTAIANTAFRKAWYYGLDLTNYWRRTNAITPMLLENNYYSMKGLVNTSDGIEYTELVRRELGLPAPNGRTPARLDAAKARQYKEQAMRELRALGVTFPIKIDYYVAGSNQTAIDTGVIIKQIFSDCLGDDFVSFEVNTYVSSVRQEVINPRLQCVAITGWGADYGDPQNFMVQEVYDDDNAYFSVVYKNINDVAETPATRELLGIYREFTRLVRVADAISQDLDARYRAFAKAEAYMIDNVITVPLMYQQQNAIGRIDNTSRLRAVYGMMDMRFKNWRTNKNGYTTAEAEALAELYAQGRRP